MQIGVIDLGRMGGNITRRLIQNGHEAVVYDHDANAVAVMSRDIGAKGLDALVDELRAPRAIWIMLPAGKITEDTIVQLGRLLAPDEIIIEGGNTFWKDDIRRAKMLKGRSIHYVDVGTSGGVWDPPARYPRTINQLGRICFPENRLGKHMGNMARALGSVEGRT